MKRMAPLVVIAAVALGVFAFMRSRGEVIDGARAQALVEAGATLVDVRSPQEFGGGHIEGARNIPVDEIGARAGELDKDETIVVYCRSGVRSGRAKRTLEAQGFGDVHNLGAMSRW